MLFRDATAEDFETIIKVLRPADAEEWRAATGRYPTQLWDQGWRPAGLEGGDEDLHAVTRVATHEGVPMILYGVNSQGPVPGMGWAWLIAAQDAPQHYKAFRRMWDAEIDDLIERTGYTRWLTASWVGNPAHHKWLQAMGFRQLGPRTTINGERFQPYTFTRT